MLKKNTGIKRVFKAAFYSYKGLSHAVFHEAAFRQEAILAALLLPIALWLDISAIERLLLIGSLFLVLIVELLNTGIEAVVDRVSLDYHELAGRAKDMGSAAVMLSLFYCLIVWGTVLYQQFTG